MSNMAHPESVNVGPVVNVQELIVRLSELDVTLDVLDGTLRVNAPAGVLDEALRNQIADHKDRLIAKLAAVRPSEAPSELPRIVPDTVNRHLPFPLNDVQHAYWVGRNGHFELGSVATHVYFEFDCAALSPERLSDALNRVIARHDMLRATVDGNGRQRIQETVPRYDIACDDLRALASTERNAALDRIRDRMSQQVLPADRWPLFEIRVAHLADDRSRLFLSCDFLMVDAWSLVTLIREWSECYLDPSHRLPPMSLSFRDYVLAESALKSQPACQASKKFWWDRLDSLPAAPVLPFAGKIESHRKYRFSRRRYVMPAARWQLLKSAGRRCGLTPTSLLLAVFAEIVTCWSKSPRYSLNLTLFNRLPMHEDVESLIGDFTNLMVFEVDGQRAGSFRARALALQESFLRDYEHSRVSGVEVLRELIRRRGLANQASFPVVFTSTLMLNESRAADSRSLERFGPITFGISQTPQVALDYQIFETNGDLIVNWDTVDDVFLPGVLDDMFDAHSRLLECLRNPEAWDRDAITELPVEQIELRDRMNDTAEPITEECLHTLFVRQALAEPERIAIDHAQRRVTYGQLLAEARAVARRLTNLGVRPNELVAVTMSKGWEQVVAVLGILLAGAAYMPVDPRWPLHRRNGLFEQGRVRVILTQWESVASLGWPAGRTVLEVSADAAVVDGAAVDGGSVTAGTSVQDGAAAVDMPRAPDDLAYVIFTSGSTGTPKGVMVSHRSAVNTVIAINKLFDVGPKDKVLAVSELTFDLSVYDIFGVLAAGGTIVIPAAARAPDPAHWADLIRDRGVTVWNSAPQLMSLLVDFLELEERHAPVRLTLLSGDWIPTKLPDRIRRWLHADSVISLGGATEGAVWSIYFPIGTVDPAWASIPYGRALPNQRMYVLNKRFEVCPDLVVGDIYIGGLGVARGYWEQPEKTARQFVTHARFPGERLYATGDMGRYRRDGHIEFLGREDSQVKLRGQRVELGEIAATLAAHSSVADASVQVVKRHGRDTLVAYIVPARAGLIPDEPAVCAEARLFTSAALEAFLAERLPEHMLPQMYVALPALPLSANGKVDAASLRAMNVVQEGDTDRPLVLPRTDLEKTIWKAWAEVLGTERIQATDNFFEVGGDSLLLTRVLLLLNRSLEPPLVIQDLLTYPTIRSLAEFVSGRGEVKPAQRAEVSKPAEPATDRIDIAVIGLAGRFPDAPTVDALWKNLANGRCSVRRFTDEQLRESGVTPEEYSRPGFVKAGIVLDDIDTFDASYFGVLPREAEIMDPQQRLLLECAVEALENAGYPSEKYAGRIGVFVGKGTSFYLHDHVMRNPFVAENVDLLSILSLNEKDYAATMLSYKLNLTGPSLSVNTACSTSLVAVHMAYRSLIAGECEVALAGGVSIINTLKRLGYVYEEGHVRSADGYCRAFSDDSDGCAFGSGAGLVVLKPLARALRDRDTIHAVIRGSAINNDGSMKVGYTAPSVQGQAAAIAGALERAAVPPETIQYIEAHGTGTNLGDPIELRALRQVLGGPRADGSRCALGSVKTNLGHLESAAGVAGLIKVVESLKHGQIPPSLHFTLPNRKIDFDDSPFFVNTRLRDWPAGDVPRRAGVSSFGVGGTNAHVILEEAPRIEAEKRAARSELILLSAKAVDAVRRLAYRLADSIAATPDAALADVANTLQVGRVAHAFRAFAVCDGLDQAQAALRAGSSLEIAEVDSTSSPAAVFLFAGDDLPKPGAAFELYRTQSGFRGALDACATIISEIAGWDPRVLLYPERPAPEEVSLSRAEFAQPTLFSIEYAMAAFWNALGVRPAALLGSGVGEYVAATIAGVFSLKDALRVVIRRASLLERLPEDGMVAEFEQLLMQVERKAPREPVVSSVTGDWLSPEEATSPRYWAQQLKQPTRFGEGIETVLRRGRFLKLEIGCAAYDRRSLLHSVGRVWAFGFDLDWQALHEDAKPRRIPLPTYPFARSRFWLERPVSVPAASAPVPYDLEEAADVDPPSSGESPFDAIDYHFPPFEPRALEAVASSPCAESGRPESRPNMSAPYVAPVNRTQEGLIELWESFLGIHGIGINDNFFELGGDSLLATRVYASIKAKFKVDLPTRRMFEFATVRYLYLFIAANRNADLADELTEEELEEIVGLMER